MNNNTKARFKKTTRKSRSAACAGRNPRNAWNKRGKVISVPRKKNSQAAFD